MHVIPKYPHFLSVPHPVCACGLFNSITNPKGDYAFKFSDDQLEIPGPIDVTVPLTIPMLASPSLDQPSPQQLDDILHDLNSEPYVREIDLGLSRRAQSGNDQSHEPPSASSQTTTCQPAYLEACLACDHRQDICLFDPSIELAHKISPVGTSSPVMSKEEILEGISRHDPFQPLGLPINDSLINLLKSRWTVHGNETISTNENFSDSYQCRPRFVNLEATRHLLAQQQIEQSLLYQQFLQSSQLSSRDMEIDSFGDRGLEDDQDED
eukprot:Gregarina_sp_Poly_1__6752@NODE_363_length_9191_cov_154_197830_g299_i0_p4_GENE_NODE_363_length_9191_cov_154_197830_g299_i0NODE_363_length_9191_cov_154_197830_g299_i0_p4_ORF_typecomplete_len267_score27_33_NODE_363_length_9191_cov_154_197830_g299_i055016301